MSCKSFPVRPDDCQVVWCLDKNDIAEGLKDLENAQFLHNPDIVVVQVPISHLALSRNAVLRDLNDANMLKANNLLIFNGDHISSEQKFFHFSKMVEDFLNTSLRKAHAYSRFFAVLGAKHISISQEREKISSLESNLHSSLDGMMSKFAEYDAHLDMHIKKTLSEIMSINTSFHQKNLAPMTDRIAKAHSIMQQEGLVEDIICTSFIKKLMDGASISSHSCQISGRDSQTKGINALLEIGFKFPAKPASGKTSKSSDISFIKLKNKLEVMQTLSENFNFHLSLKF